MQMVTIVSGEGGGAGGTCLAGPGAPGYREQQVVVEKGNMEKRGGGNTSGQAWQT